MVELALTQECAAFHSPNNSCFLIRQLNMDTSEMNTFHLLMPLSICITSRLSDKIPPERLISYFHPDRKFCNYHKKACLYKISRPILQS